jgi:SAM-dependent methyltransferase
MWTDQYTEADRVLFQDMRIDHNEGRGPYWECVPEVQADTRAMPYQAGTFDLVTLDPPHVVSSDGMAGLTGWIEQKYGALTAETWQDDLRRAFDECWRVLRPGGVLTMKWADSHRDYQAVLDQLEQTPLFGTKTNNRPNGTRWFTFHKPRDQEGRP